MPQPVKISDALLAEARVAGEVMHRSINGQIEHWAQLGRAMEKVLNGQQLHQLRAAGPVPRLSEVLASVSKPEGRARLQAVLDAEPYPHFRQLPGRQRLFERLEEDGTRTVGRVVGRDFVADPEIEAEAQLA